MTWVAVTLLGGVVGLDSTAFPQVMISRPLVAGALTGIVFGRPLEGVVVGFLLETFALVVLPIGAARYPESGTGAVAAASAYLAVTPAAAGIQPGTLLLAVLLGLGWELVAGETVVRMRRGNGRLLIRSVSAGQLERRHLGAMAIDFARGGIVAVSGGLIGYGVLLLVSPLWALGEPWTVAILGVVAAAMIASTLPLLGGRARLASFAAGAVLGLALAVAA